MYQNNRSCLGGSWELELRVFSDEPMREAFTTYSESNSIISARTTYHVDDVGKVEKTLNFNDSFVMDREPIAQFDNIRKYSSEMTELDFMYAEQALWALKDYLVKYSEQGQIKANI